MVWLAGNKGMLGKELAGCLADAGIGFYGTDRECDITDPRAVGAVMAEHKPEWIVNCAAYTAVDKAEDERELAMRLNAEGPFVLATVAERNRARLIHISTDYVFSGEGSRPWTEDDPVGPVGMYGLTKAEGERLVAAACPRHFILRTAWLYGEHGNNFVRTMLSLMESRESVGVVADQRGTPTWARDLARAIVKIIRDASTEYGIYHYTNEGETSWHEFALEIQELGLKYGLLSRRIPVAPLRTDEYPTRTKRPAWSVLSKEKIRQKLSVLTPDWKSSLDAYLAGIAKARS